MSTTRQTHLDALRGLAALLVVIAHHLAVFYPYTVFGAQGNYIQHAGWEELFFLPPLGLLVSGQFAVSLFFILSGYVLSYNFLGEQVQVQKLVAAIVKRPIRLGGLVVFTIAAAVVLWYAGLFYNGAVADVTNSKPFFQQFWVGSPDLSRALSDLTTSAFSNGRFYNPPLWTIKMELYGSILVFLFLLLFGASRYRLLLLFVLLLLSKNSLYQGFVLGMLIADMVKHRTVSLGSVSGWRPALLLLPLFLLLSSYPGYVTADFLEGTLYRYLPNDAGFGGGYPMLAALLLFVMVTSSNSMKGLLHHRIFQFLGRISFGLYVLHFLVIGSFSSWLFLHLYQYLGYGQTFVVVLLLGLMLTLTGAYLLTRYVDDPAIRLASYIGRQAQLLMSSSRVTRLVMAVQGLGAKRTTMVNEAELAQQDAAGRD